MGSINQKAKKIQFFTHETKDGMKGGAEREGGEGEREGDEEKTKKTHKESDCHFFRLNEYI